MAKYQQYAEYKDTQDSWLSLIPNKWEVVPLKFLCLNPVKDGPHETPVFIDDGIPFLSVDGIQNNQLVFNGCRYISEKDHEKYSKKCAPVHGDILLGKAASVGKVAYVDTSIEFNVWSPLAVITPKDARLGKYIFYAFQSTMLQAQCEVYSNSNTQKNLGMNTIDNLHLPCPSYKEAEKIANFLDFETAQIDTLIEKQKTLIKLLKEKRQAVISHAVTKGLNPDAPMKESGVEWLGGIPNHWQMKKLKYVGEAKNGLTYSPDDVTEAGLGTLVLRSSNIQNTRLAFEDNVYVDMKVPERSLVRKDDILICSRNGSRRLIGKNALITEDIAGQAFGAFMVVFRSDINTYLYWILNSPLFEYQSGSFLTSTINQLTIGNLHSMEVPIPPKMEQNQIEKYLKNKMSTFDNLISKAEQAIQLMQERRTALISAAVTGKIDVRGWVAPE